MRAILLAMEHCLRRAGMAAGALLATSIALASGARADEVVAFYRANWAGLPAAESAEYYPPVLGERSDGHYALEWPRDCSDRWRGCGARWRPGLFMLKLTACARANSPAMPLAV